MYNQVAFSFLGSLVVTTTYLKDVKKKHEEKIPRCMNNSIILWENYRSMHKIATPNTYIHICSVSWFDIVTSIRKYRDQFIFIGPRMPSQCAHAVMQVFCSCE
jgi:hypothetical protein